ncbi:hypothetical protein COU61_04200 [Candidatus Pacearchaeota archaeon CG10_big_fil_rev_8_21_14_0_10_35_13]|nr:MAG: hypothetical protein COU61_04200 [Candidatus Pacearchaeota archaeon CG10_big_fil_rev_8_21_14_0_10_35_13]
MLSSIEIIALLVVLFSFIKLLFFISSNGWSRFVSVVYSHPKVTSLISVVLIIIVMYYLLFELSIVQIMAVLSLFFLLFVIGIIPFSKELLPSFKRILESKNLIKKSWLITIIWLVLSLWVLEVLFF